MEARSRERRRSQDIIKTNGMCSAPELYTKFLLILNEPFPLRLGRNIEAGLERRMENAMAKLAGKREGQDGATPRSILQGYSSPILALTAAGETQRSPR